MKKPANQVCFDAMKDMVRCIKTTKCYEVKNDVQFCMETILPDQCMDERKNYWICRASMINPTNRYKRIRGQTVSNKYPER